MCGIYVDLFDRLDLFDQINLINQTDLIMLFYHADQVDLLDQLD